jgi:5'-methylthioadenosine phosphorylase
VTIDIILNNLRKNVENAKQTLKQIILQMPKERSCTCKEALKYAIVTDKQYVSKEIKEKLDVIAGKYLR